MRLIYLLLGLLGLLYSIFVISITRLDTGAAAIICLSLLLMAIFFFYDKIKYLLKENKVLRLFILTGITLCLLCALILEGLILSSINDEHPKNIDYVLVLGAGIKKGEPSRVLKERLNKAAAYIKTHPDSKTVVSGGLSDGENQTEAKVMGSYLKKKGIPSDAIIYENKATSTFENIKFSRDLMKAKLAPHKKQRILLISSNFHLHRAKLLAGELGIKAYGQGSQIPLSVTPQVHVREILALAKFYVFDKSWF